MLGGNTPLLIACRKGHVDDTRLLLEAGDAADQATGGRGTTPLFVDCTGLLLEAGATVEQANEGGATPLYIACREGNVDDCTRLLLEAGAAVDQATDGGFTPLFIAYRNRYVECTRLLLEAGDAVDTALESGFTLLFTVCPGEVHYTPSQTSLETLLRLKARAAMEGGCQQAQIKCVRLLLNAVFAINQAKTCGVAPLYIACYWGQVECTRLLIEAGAAVDQAGAGGATPLFVACQMGHVECTRLLLEAGAAVGQARTCGTTPLHIACQQGNIECTRLLLEAGAAVDQAVETVGGSSPLYSACRTGQIECTRLLLEAGAAVDQGRASGATPLFIACRFGHSEAAQLLSSYGATRKEDLVKRTRGAGRAAVADWLQLSDGWTPLHHLEALTAERVTVLLRSGTNCPHALPSAGAGPTPLTRAHELQQQGQAPDGSAAALLIAATGLWSPETHHFFPAPARACARAAICVGFCLAHRWNDMGFYHVWRDVVMPLGIERETLSAAVE
jgi:ankyrin repeat protein